MVAIIYRTDGAWGTGQGFVLTGAQVDTNFYNLSQAVDNLISNPPTAVSIASFTVTGNLLYINMTNATVQGPFTLPSSSFNPKGVWQPNTAYGVNDLISYGATAYLVPFAHTSAATFDPAANDGLGHNFYSVFLTMTGQGIPAGGDYPQVLMKKSSADFDVDWGNGVVPTGGAAGAVLTKNTTTSFDMAWIIPGAVGGGGLPIKVVSAASYTFVNGDQGQYIRFTNTTLTINFPTFAGASIPVGSELTFRIVNALVDAITIVVPAGVGVNAPQGFTTKPFGPGAVVTAKQIAQNSWDLFGLLQPA